MRGHSVLFGIALSTIAVACNTSREGKPATSTATAPADTAATTGPTTAPAKTPTPRPTSKSTDEPMPDPITHPCVVTAVNYEQAIERGKTDCKTNADCGCYQGGIGRKSGCGGVLNTASVKELDAIAKRFFEMKCKHTQHCAAWACQPRCEAGHCRR